MANSNPEITIRSTCSLPFVTGTIYIDNSGGSITIHMPEPPAHNLDQFLRLVKISDDKHTISLCAETPILNGGEFIMFGLHRSAKTTLGKNKTLLLQGDGSSWLIK